VSINIRQQDHSETGSIYCIIKFIVQGKQAFVKHADLRHPSCTVVMYKRKSASPVLNVLIFSILVINTTKHSDNTTQQSVENVRRY